MFLFVCLFGLEFYSYGHVETITSPNHTFFLGKLELTICIRDISISNLNGQLSLFKRKINPRSYCNLPNSENPESRNSPENLHPMQRGIY